MTVPTQTVPTQTVSPEPQGSKLPEDRRHMIGRRWLTAITIVLLVGIPAGYLAISAGQSRDSGRDKERESSATGLRENWPSQMKRRVFEVPIPPGSSSVAYYETSNWRTSRLYVQFTTSAGRLDAFLNEVGSSRSQLLPGEVTVSGRDADIVGWHFPSGHDWSGTSISRDKPRPSQDITVDLSDPAAPQVYVVSTATP
ncbi:hypothetical protein J7E93_27260 [Streptomyces sp. ISL-36]|uniref:hypothetical protein n=1 Tax=Streptomyces sp. ISL-36 TaxID=2819182 RepID=UPI001BE96D97|nr:hypothetical protein [Streptomyces sp. ISL-36]MBT2443730.1 hypothetical protein [Streptomyces sp. ISL-36]